MKIDTFLLELEDLLEQKGYEIRKESGSFRGNSCVMKGDQLIMLNKKSPPEINAGIMVRLLYEIKVDDIYVPPNIRQELLKWWKKYPDFETDGTFFTERDT